MKSARLWLILVMAFSFTLTFVIAGCDVEVPGAGTPFVPSRGSPTPERAIGEEEGGTTAAVTSAPTVSVMLVVNTPTPQPIPPTPTPRPTPTPSEGEDAARQLTEMVEIPAGPFIMGRDDVQAGAEDETPAHEVELPTYYIEMFEVTNVQFAAFVEDTGYVTDAENSGDAGWRNFAAGKDNHPVVKVSWNDAQAYCEWAERRLPTEAEWEKAARGMEGSLYPWGNDWNPQNANVKEAGFRGTTSVGSFTDGASAYGVFDMAGNVWEWTSDWYQPYPGNAVADEFYGEKFKVTRGGGWFDEQDQVLATNRSAAPVEAANDDIGFRCASDG